MGSKYLAPIIGVASLLLASSAHAYFASVTEIGQASQAAGSATLVITTSAACPVNGAIVLFITGVGASGALSPTVVDQVANSYSALAQFTGTGNKITFSGTPGGATGVTRNLGLPSGDTITITAGSTTLALAAIAACIQTPTFNSSFNDVNGAGASGSGTAIGYTPTINAQINDLMIIGTVEVAGAANTWTESAGYNSLAPVLNVNATRLAWQIVAGLTPSAYSATNSASITWSSRGRSFIPCVSSLALTGAGQC